MATIPKLLFVLLVGVVAGLISGLSIRGQQVKTPPGYLITEAEITDPAALQTYGDKLAATLAPFSTITTSFVPAKFRLSRAMRQRAGS